MNQRKNGKSQTPVKERSEKKAPVCGKAKTKNFQKETAVQGTSEKTKKTKTKSLTGKLQKQRKRMCVKEKSKKYGIRGQCPYDAISKSYMICPL